MIDADVVVRLIREQHAKLRRAGAPADPKDKEPLRVVQQAEQYRRQEAGMASSGDLSSDGKLPASGRIGGEQAAAGSVPPGSDESLPPQLKKRLFFDAGVAPPVRVTLGNDEVRLAGGSQVAAHNDASL